MRKPLNLYEVEMRNQLGNTYGLLLKAATPEQAKQKAAKHQEKFEKPDQILSVKAGDPRDYAALRA